MIKDGIIHKKTYNKTTPKILWILKEAHDPDKGDWDLREFLHDRNRYLLNYKSKKPGGKIIALWPRTWGLVIKVSYAIINNLKSLEEINLSLRSCASVLDSIAVINIKKESGVNRASPKELDHFIRKPENQNEIYDQIQEEIKPDIIICGGTYDLIKKYGIAIPTDYQKDSDWGGLFNNQMWIDAYHPNQSTITHEKYFERINSVILQNPNYAE